MHGRFLSRRRLLALASHAAVTGLIGACTDGGEDHIADTPPNNPDDALARLMAGNARYAGFDAARPNQSRARREEVAGGQAPWALVWGCIDSRVAPEVLFDQGLGDLFVVRTAGQAIDSVSLGSVEFGVEEFHLPLVLVLGHERCGAVTAVQHTLEGSGTPPGAVGAVVTAIRPAVEEVLGQTGNVIDNAVRANVRLQVEQLRRSPVLTPAVTAGRLRIAGALYDLDTGLVEFNIA